MRFNDESFSLLASAQAGQVLGQRAMVGREHPRGREEVVLTTILSLHPEEHTTFSHAAFIICSYLCMFLAKESFLLISPIPGK